MRYQPVFSTESLQSLWLYLILGTPYMPFNMEAFLTVACHCFLSSSPLSFCFVLFFPFKLVHLPLANEACLVKGSGPDVD